MPVHSSMISLGSSAPDFKLTDTRSDRVLSLNDVRGKEGTIIMFICNHCPYVKHINNELVRLANDYIPIGMGFVAISSNDPVTYPEDHPEKMKVVAKQLGYPFPYLFDETQEIARAYDAVCTPDFFLYDSKLKLVYRGQLDDSRPGSSVDVTGKDLRLALDNLINQKPINPDQKPSVGCSIKWK
ncbi:MAG: thioredoxin family protein [Flammeovirgaceae bacterium]|nr:thioredoxin family protein [Flammeovirgaceae bacterium]